MTKGVRSLPAARSDPGHLQTSADDTVKDGPTFICQIGRLEFRPPDACSPVWPFPNSSVLLRRVRAARAVRKPRPSSSAVREGSLSASQCPPQTQRDDFAGSQAVSGQQHQKGVIPSANWRSNLDGSLPRRPEPPRDAAPKEFAHRHRSVVRSRYCSDRGRFVRCHANSARSFEGTPCSPRSFADANPCKRCCRCASTSRTPKCARLSCSPRGPSSARNSNACFVRFDRVTDATRATPASTCRILVPDRSEMPRWPSLGWLQRANVHAPAARTRSRQFCCGDAIRKRCADSVRAAYANFEAPNVGSRRTPAHGPLRRRYISSQGNQQTAAQSTSSAVEAPRRNGLFLGDFRIRPIGTQSKSIQWT